MELDEVTRREGGGEAVALIGGSRRRCSRRPSPELLVVEKKMKMKMKVLEEEDEGASRCSFLYSL